VVVVWGQVLVVPLPVVAVVSVVLQEQVLRVRVGAAVWFGTQQGTVVGVMAVVPHDDEIVDADGDTDKEACDGDSDDTPLMRLLRLALGTNGAAWTFHNRDILS
jgi:hypothetical protein